ncbi:PR domain zinc finger protein 5-like [Patiria miniata]|uniref:C2H2-type domain-containing protein n=1 Tax=Patiria miniata TaxID=46514 RepID=A0A914AW91_PATMI|nr:PR domain zinc finger protein 5-like [Patiria miniata]
MASEVASVSLEEDNGASDKPTGTQQTPSSSERADNVVPMETDEATEDKRPETEDKPSSDANQLTASNEDEDWSRAQQCSSAFVIEVFQCKLCSSFNSTRKTAITKHLKDKHAREWETLKGADNPSSLATSSKENSLTQGDLEEMLERELTRRNQGKADVTPTATPQQSTVIAVPVQQAVCRGPQKITGAVPVGNNAVFLPFVSVQPNLQPKLVRVPMQSTSRRRPGRPKSLLPKVVRIESLQSKVTPQGASVQSKQSQAAPPVPSQISLRPGLRQSANRKPKEFKDFVVLSPGKRNLASGDKSNGDDSDDDFDVEEETDEDLAEDAHEVDKQSDKKVQESEKELEDRPKESQQSQAVSPLKEQNVVKKKFQCPDCLMRFASTESLKRHKDLKRCIGIPITGKEFPCPDCKYVGTAVTSLKVHMQSHKQRRQKKYGCVHCKKGFTSIKGVKVHRRNNCCPALKQKKPKGPRMYPCELCGRQCKEKRGLTEHMASHSEIRQHKCDFCKKGFKTSGALRRHRKKHQDRFFYCDLCKFKSRWRSSLKTHFEAHHAEDTREWLQCPQCPHQTKNKYYLKRHIESHTDTRMFICEVCGKDYKTQVILNCHRETHQNGVYPCEKCDYVGKTKMQLYSHQLVHIPRDKMTFKCDQCNWVGKRKSELSIHYRKHSALKLYQCGACGKSYKHKHALTRHMNEKHFGKALDLSTLEVHEISPHTGENTVLHTVQDMIDRAQMGLKVTHEGQSLSGIPAIVQAAQQYQLMQGSEMVEEVEADHADQMITHQNPNVAVTFEITTSGGVHRRSHVQTAQ